jgi:hypothetical protein
MLAIDNSAETTRAADSQALSALVTFDTGLREQERVRREMVAELQTVRSTIGILAAQIHATKTRVAVLEAGTREGAETPALRRDRDALLADELRYAALVRSFEDKLRRAEAVQARVRDETRRIEAERRDVLERLSPRVRSLCVELVLAGIVPPTATNHDGACSACAATLLPSVSDDPNCGVFPTCPGCRRLLLCVPPAE